MTELPLLGGYDAKRCARRVHNDHDPTMTAPDFAVSAELQARFDAGNAFEERVFAAIRTASGDACVVLADDLGATQRIAETMTALERGTPVVLGGQLPHDRVGGRVGKPDILVRWDGGYVPADVKHHRITKIVRTKSATLSTFADPATMLDVEGRAPELSSRFDDYVQLAHYTRMLQAVGLHPGEEALVGAIIGSDDLSDVDPSGHAFTWLRLDTPIFTTFSRSSGRRKRSAMERYDHEHGFRLKVAANARNRSGGPDAPPPLVVPIWQEECHECLWHQTCRDELGADAPSAAIISGNLDVREWLALRDAGVTTTSALAALDADDPSFLDAYLPQVTHQPQALKRLEAAVERAEMIRDGITLKRTTPGPLDVPTADIEIDFDIEWDADQQVYLWGFRVADNDSSYYRAFVRWAPLDEQSEQDLGQEMLLWLREQIRAARSAGRSIRIYHYTAAEVTHLNRVFGAEEIADVAKVLCDLHPLIRDNFVGVAGLGIKKVAPAFGFEWRDDDPGGLQSQGWFVAATSPEPSPEREAARQRLLAYNEDDVCATAAIRRGPSDSRKPVHEVPAASRVQAAHPLGR